MQTTGAAPLKRAKPREGEVPGKMKLSMSMAALEPLNGGGFDGAGNSGLFSP